MKSNAEEMFAEMLRLIDEEQKANRRLYDFVAAKLGIGPHNSFGYVFDTAVVVREMLDESKSRVECAKECAHRLRAALEGGKE